MPSELSPVSTLVRVTLFWNRRIQLRRIPATALSSCRCTRTCVLAGRGWPSPALDTGETEAVGARARIAADVGVVARAQRHPQHPVHRGRAHLDRLPPLERQERPRQQGPASIRGHRPGPAGETFLCLDAALPAQALEPRELLLGRRRQYWSRCWCLPGVRSRALTCSVEAGARYTSSASNSLASASPCRRNAGVTGPHPFAGTDIDLTGDGEIRTRGDHTGALRPTSAP